MANQSMLYFAIYYNTRESQLVWVMIQSLLEKIHLSYEFWRFWWEKGRVVRTSYHRFLHEYISLALKENRWNLLLVNMNTKRASSACWYVGRMMSHLFKEIIVFIICFKLFAISIRFSLLKLAYSFFVIRGRIRNFYYNKLQRKIYQTSHTINTWPRDPAIFFTPCAIFIFFQ